jgi:hypothetical protein
VLAVPLSAAQAPAPTPELEFVKVGETLPPFEATGVDGTVRPVKYEKPTVLVFFLSGCPVCHKMIPEWNQAFDRKPKGLEVVGILMDREPDVSVGILDRIRVGQFFHP